MPAPVPDLSIAAHRVEVARIAGEASTRVLSLSLQPNEHINVVVAARADVLAVRCGRRRCRSVVAVFERGPPLKGCFHAPMHMGIDQSQCFVPVPLHSGTAILNDFPSRASAVTTAP